MHSQGSGVRLNRRLRKEQSSFSRILRNLHLVFDVFGKTLSSVISIYKGQVKTVKTVSPEDTVRELSIYFPLYRRPAFIRAIKMKILRYIEILENRFLIYRTVEKRRLHIHQEFPGVSATNPGPESDDNYELPENLLNSARPHHRLDRSFCEFRAYTPVFSEFEKTYHDQFRQ